MWSGRVRCSKKASADRAVGPAVRIAEAFASFPSAQEVCWVRCTALLTRSTQPGLPRSDINVCGQMRIASLMNKPKPDIIVAWSNKVHGRSLDP